MIKKNKASEVTPRDGSVPAAESIGSIGSAGRRHLTRLRPFLSNGLARSLAVCSVFSFAIVTTSAPHGMSSHIVRHWAPSGCGTQGTTRNEVSSQLPPRRLRGYTLAYCNDFRGSNLSRGWGRFSGVPGGDPSGMFVPSHVVVENGMLTLNTYRDPANNNGWATGGLCQCGVAHTYGAYFVRSRVTGSGDDEVQLLWPAAHVWPPEVDFNETGSQSTKTAWYVHYRSSNDQVAKTLHVNLTMWHTWGVIWKARSLTFTVDGVVWGIVRNQAMIPHEGMTLDIQQQTWCGIAPECPTKPLSMLVDWVAEFVPARH
jgi:hypothetical protein